MCPLCLHFSQLADSSENSARPKQSGRSAVLVVWWSVTRIYFCVNGLYSIILKPRPAHQIRDPKKCLAATLPCKLAGGVCRIWYLLLHYKYKTLTIVIRQLITKPKLWRWRETVPKATLSVCFVLAAIQRILGDELPLRFRKYITAAESHGFAPSPGGLHFIWTAAVKGRCQLMKYCRLIKDFLHNCTARPL